MNYIKHSLLNISKLITDAIAKGNVETHEFIHSKLPAGDRIISTIYKKENVGVYVVEKYINDYDSFTYLYAKEIPEKDLHTIEKTVKQMLSIRR